MSKEVFQFRQFTVCQDQCAMKVGTDGVLLGAWACTNGPRLLDVGTGTGLVALMLAQRYPAAQILGVDIDGAAARQACDNFAASPWADRLAARSSDFMHLPARDSWDCIVSNPPFYENTLPTSSWARDKARSGQKNFLNNLLNFSLQHLSFQGVLNVILPTKEGLEFAFEAWTKNLYTHRKTLICTKQGKAPKRVLLTLGRTPQMPLEETICLLDGEGQRTREYLQLTQTFYL